MIAMQEIIDINWERANLILKFNNNIDGDCYLKNEKNKNILPIKLDHKENLIILNIYNISDKKAIEQGNWNIVINNTKVTINKEIISKFEDKSRIFKYNGNYALLVSFDTNESLSFCINVDYMIRNYKYKKY